MAVWRARLTDDLWFGVSRRSAGLGRLGMGGQGGLRSRGSLPETLNVKPELKRVIAVV